MAPNFRCRFLIVYGPFAPGRERHKELLNTLAQEDVEVTKGNIIAVPGSTVEEFNFYEGTEPCAAWVAKVLPDPVGRHDKDWEVKAWETWDRLDKLFGKTMARNSCRFWPEGAEAGVVGDEMMVVNTYMNAETHSIRNQDVPHPTNNNILHLWLEVVRGEKRYDESLFCGMINDLGPGTDKLEAYFGELPNKEGFLDRLTRLFGDHTIEEKHPSDAGQGKFHLYFHPLEKHKVSNEELLELARRHIATQVEACERLVTPDRPVSSEVQAGRDNLKNLTFEVVADPNTRMYDDGDGEMLRDDFGEGACAHTDPGYWVDCLVESCYSIAASYELQRWLMQDWLVTNVDLEPLYEFWRAGGRTVIRDGVAHVFVRRR